MVVGMCRWVENKEFKKSWCVVDVEGSDKLEGEAVTYIIPIRGVVLYLLFGLAGDLRSLPYQTRPFYLACLHFHTGKNLLFLNLAILI